MPELVRHALALNVDILCLQEVEADVFAALDAKVGPLPAGRYMSRPRDGRTKNWDLFTRP